MDTKTGYLILDNYHLRIRRRKLIDHMSLETAHFDAIAFRGLSGSLVAPSVADALDKPLIHVRKPSEASHSYLEVEGAYGAKRIAIVDDFIATGRTVSEIARVIHNSYTQHEYETPEFPFIFLYNSFDTVDRYNENNVRNYSYFQHTEVIRIPLL